MNRAEHRVGAWTVVKVNELDLNDFTAAKLLPDLTPEALLRMPGREDPRLYDPETGTVPLSVHTWVVRDGGRTILIDTGIGNDKPRPTMLMFDHLQTPYLERLADGRGPGRGTSTPSSSPTSTPTTWGGTRDSRTATGCRPSRTPPSSAPAGSGGTGRPWPPGTTPGQRRSGRLPASATRLGRRSLGVFEDSMAPVGAAGRVRLIEVDGGEVLDGFRYLPTPGHSIDHASIALTSQGEAAVFGGDVIHHPFEIIDPELVSMFCEFPDAARRSRVRLLEHLVETRALYFSSHFTGSSAGHVVRGETDYHWVFLD